MLYHYKVINQGCRSPHQIMFKTDGSVHHGGIQNELDTIDFLNSIERYQQLVEHRGGTGQKADAVCEKYLSIKRKKGIKNGSFDWCNTSIYNDTFGDHFTKFLEDVKQHRQLPVELREVAVTFLRNDLNNLCETALESLSADRLIALLKDIFSKQEGYDIVINDTESREVFIFAAEQHPVLAAIEQGYIPELVSTRGAKSSRKIVFRKGNETINTGLRLRVTSNNGINAFLGLSKANKNSQIVVKLQQDAVGQLVKDANADVYNY